MDFDLYQSTHGWLDFPVLLMGVIAIISLCNMIGVIIEDADRKNIPESHSISHLVFVVSVWLMVSYSFYHWHMAGR